MNNPQDSEVATLKQKLKFLPLFIIILLVFSNLYFIFLYLEKTGLGKNQFVDKDLEVTPTIKQEKVNNLVTENKINDLLPCFGHTLIVNSLF